MREDRETDKERQGKRREGHVCITHWESKFWRCDTQHNDILHKYRIKKYGIMALSIMTSNTNTVAL